MKSIFFRKSLWDSQILSTFACVFFIVLDLRLTRYWVTAVTLFLFLYPVKDTKNAVLQKAAFLMMVFIHIFLLR